MKRIIPINWFVCPVTKEVLSHRNEHLVSSAGIYHNEELFWNFTPNQEEIFSDKKWKTWEKLQENGVVSYESSPQNNLGVGKRYDFLNFAEFCDFRPLVLDIGVGPQKCPTHIEYNTKTDIFFIGIDPLVGEQPRDFAFVQGLGEFLPFVDELFDQVIYVTSLDHFIDPVQTLLEAKRVLKADGEICIWIGEKDKNAPRPAVSPEWYQQLEVPQGAEDPFHFKRFSIAEFEEYVQKAELRITKQVVHEVDAWRKNCFYKLSK